MECARTRTAFLWTSILNTPFWAIYNLLPFILFRDLGATPWQITVMITLKPVVSLFSVYWSEHVHQRRDRLVSNVSWGCILSHLPFFFFPWIDNPWYFIAAFAVYMLLYRGVMPAWMEILKLNLPSLSRQKIFAYASTLSYIGAALLPAIFGWIMDLHFQSWRWIFPIAALVSLSAVWLQWKIPIAQEPANTEEPSDDLITRPWRHVWELLNKRTDYLGFQVGFMLGGFGIMVLQPALPEFFMGDLQLNYVELGFAMALCKGVGFAITSKGWAHWVNASNIFLTSSVVMILGALFPLGLLMTQSNVLWLYVAYLVYGVMQAGSELVWRMSGPLFAKEEDSSLYSAVNVLAVGVRGCVANPLGGLLLVMFSPSVAMGLGIVLCLLAGVHMFICSRQLELGQIPVPK